MRILQIHKWNFKKISNNTTNIEALGKIAQNFEKRMEEIGTRVMLENM